MQIRLRVSPNGKIPEIYRGKRTAFLDVNGGFANVDSKGDIVGDDAHLTLPYQDDDTGDNDYGYQDMIRKTTKQIARMLSKKKHAIEKRGHVSTTRDKHKHQTTTKHYHQTSAPPTPKLQIASSSAVDQDDNEPQQQHENIVDIDVDSMMTSMFEQVGDFDMSELLRHLETSQPEEDDENEEQKIDKDEECKEEEEEAEEEGDEGEDDIIHEEYDNEEEDRIVSTLYKDGKIVEPGNFDDDDILPEEEDEKEEADDNEEEEEDCKTNRKPRKKRSQEDEEDDDDDTTKLDDEDETLLFDSAANDLVVDGDDLFDMYDGLAEVYQEED